MNSVERISKLMSEYSLFQSIESVDISSLIDSCMYPLSEDLLYTRVSERIDKLFS